MVLMVRFLFIASFILLIFFTSCNKSKQKNYPEISNREIKEPMIKENKRLVREESLEIDQYVQRHKWEMTNTGTGLRYMIYQNGKGEKAAVGKYATVNFKIYLLNGTLCYSSEQSGPKEFLIGKSDVESGLHEGILYLKVGDKAKFILPPHLAHGLLGDTEKIPANATIVYDVELLSLR